MRPVMQTLWDLMEDLEVKDLKATNGKITRFALQEMSFKRLLKEGVKEVFASGAYFQGHGVQAPQFAWFVKWGMKPADALRMATTNAAESLNFNMGKRSRHHRERQVHQTWSPSPATRSSTLPKWSA